ncbi:hypothetical protein KAR28_05380 [Candidatus Parcubacteria bacterium]|nr:hypothetical protein [Candidatus Parcubacteria bacterium]
MTKTEKSVNQDIDDLEIEIEKEEETKSLKDKANDEGIIISNSKLALIRSLLLNIKESNEKILDLFSGTISVEDEARIGIGQIIDPGDTASISPKSDEAGESRVIEGVFDGENMIGPDGKQYSIPANYASKSKLVEGDILKLTITGAGTFVYKQIGPIERKRVVGVLEQGSGGNYTVVSEDKKWRVLTASATYFKGQDGDEVVILLPKTGESKWAAVENIVKQVN